MARKSLFELINNASKEERDYAKEFLTDYIYATQKWDSMNQHKASNTVSPSGMKCNRAMVYKLSGAEKDEDSKSYQIIDICNNGSERHEAIQRMVYNMKSLGLDCEFLDVGKYVEEKNLPLRVGVRSEFDKGIFETHLYSDEYRASFLCDGIIKYKDKIFILEIKTESSGKFIRQEDVMEEHKAQATAYSMFLGIPSVLFLYENRDVLSKKSFLYTPTEADKNTLKQRILFCIDCADKGTVPEIPKEADNKFCQYCNYKTKCNNDEISSHS